MEKNSKFCVHGSHHDDLNSGRTYALDSQKRKIMNTAEATTSESPKGASCHGMFLAGTPDFSPSVFLAQSSLLRLTRPTVRVKNPSLDFFIRLYLIPPEGS